MEAKSPDDTLQSLRETLNRTHLSAAELLKNFPADDSQAVSAVGFREGLSKLGFVLSDAQFQSMLEKLEKDSSGNVLLPSLERRLTRTGTKSRASSKPAAAANVQSVTSNTPSAQVDAEDGQSRGLEPQRFGGPDRYGALTARERRMASHRRKPTKLAPMSDGDFVLAKIKGMLNRRKVRSVDVFKFLDVHGTGFVSRKDFCTGLERLGVEKLTPSERSDLLFVLGSGSSGAVSLEEFNKALKAAEKKARSEGRHELVDTWSVPCELLDFVGTSTTTDWSTRTLKFDSQYRGDERSTSKCLTSRNVTQSIDFDAALDFTQSSFVDEEEVSSSRVPLAASSNSWLQASGGPLTAALCAPIGCGNLHDNYILRQRLVANTWASRPPSLEFERLPLYKYGQFQRAIAETRWGAEPVGLPDERMHATRDGCLTASRSRCQDVMDRGREKFRAPLLQSVVDSVVFGRDLDFSANTDYDDAFKAKFKGAYGKPTWFSEEEERLGPHNRPGADGIAKRPSEHNEHPRR